MLRSLPPMLAALVAAAPAQAATRDFPVAGFDRIDLAGIADVAVHTGAGFAVHADGDAPLVEALVIENRHGALFIGLRPGTHVSRGTVRVAVAMPRIVGANAGGTGAIAIDRVQGAGFDARLSGTGSLRLPDLAVGTVRVAMSGTGAATVAGRADRIDLSLSGTGRIDAARLVARGGRIEASGVGSVGALVNGPVEVVASGIASVTVAGRPACTVHRSGVGTVRCG